MLTNSKKMKQTIIVSFLVVAIFQVATMPIKTTIQQSITINKFKI